MPRSFMYTRQFAVPRSMPTSVEKSPLILENELGKHDVYYRRNARGAEGGVFNTLIPQFFRDSLSRFLARSQKTLGGKLRPSWWACVGRREGRNVLRPWRGGAGRLRVLRPVNTEYVIVFQGWCATSGRVRRAISLRNAPTGNPVHPPNHGGNVTGTCGRGRRPGGPPPARDVRQSDLVRGAGRARDARPYQRRGPHAPRPTCGGGRGRRGYGRDKRGPPAWHRAISLRNARVPAPRHEAPAPPQDEISPRNNLESRRAARRVRHVRPSPGLPRRPGRGEKRMRSRFLPIACLS